MKPDMTPFEESLAKPWINKRWLNGVWGKTILLLAVVTFALILFFIINRWGTDRPVFILMVSLVLTCIPVGLVALLRYEFIKNSRSVYRHVYAKISEIINNPDLHNAEMPDIDELRERKRILYNYLEGVNTKRRTSEGPVIPEKEDEDFDHDLPPTSEYAEAARILTGDVPA